MQLVPGLGYVSVERCEHCSETHPTSTRACPATGRPMPRFMHDPPALGLDAADPAPPDPNAPPAPYTKTFKLADGTPCTLPDDPQEAWAFLATHDLRKLQGPKLDLAGLCLSGLSFSGANLAGAGLAAVVCAGTQFADAILTGACFDHAQLTR